MRQRNVTLIVVIVLGLLSLWIALPIEHPRALTNLLFWQSREARGLEMHLGLDLQGGTQVLLEAQPLEGQEYDPESIDVARTVVENRVNGLGVTEALVQVQGDRRIIVELPGITDEQTAINTIKGTGLLEFVILGDTPLDEGTLIRTSLGDPETAPSATNGGDGTITGTTTVTGTTTAPVATPYPQVFETLLTGAQLQNAVASTGELGEPVVNFQLKSEGATIFEEYTRSNVGRYVGIALDKVILSAPVIRNVIPGGQVQISGAFTLPEARNLAVQMRYGALPVPLREVSIRTVGPTLGQDSIQRSITAGMIGLGIVLVFMVVYYRVPGALAALALILYALFNLALYKLIPITLTLPGIAGFLLSTGTAVDANILIFERMKEELRWGRSLGAAIDAGFDRAWTSIRDSNLSTLITCVILYWFGSNFGASAVKGFAITLFLGVLISMFTAITCTRSFMRLMFGVMGDRVEKTSPLLPVQ